ncbi:MAG: YggS family pyridoxal phosphate-dependent enzyme [Ilumatobacteraceae bacterium]|nr:YggS family pyridoxal phosphate-dependent enzyme [Ilumatobacteraceae bacterium]
MIDPQEVALRVQQIRSEIAHASSSPVAIIAVTKTFGHDAIRAAVIAECDAVGENYAQEVLAKVAEAPIELPVHFIGAIQSNKVRQLAPYISLWQGVDRLSVISELGKRAPGAEILLQVNTTNEDTKSGVAPAEVESLLAAGQDAGLVVRGLMTIGPTSGDIAEAEKAFLSLRSLADSLHLAECSMGMSDDYLVAVACGSTMVRIGSRLFGPRIAH